MPAKSKPKSQKRQGKAEEELRKRTREIALLYQAGVKLGSSLDLHTIYNNTYKIIRDTMECDGFVISSFNPD